MKKILCIALILTMCLGFSVIGFADLMPPAFPVPHLPSSSRNDATVSNPEGARCLNKPDVKLESGAEVLVNDIAKNDAGIIVVSIKEFDWPEDSEQPVETIYEYDINDFSGNAVRSYYFKHPGDLIMRIINIISDLIKSFSERISGLAGSEA